MSDARREAAQMLDCACGHAGSLHEWEAKTQAGYVHVGPCAWREQLPRQRYDPNVHYEPCTCRAYEPAHAKDGEANG